MAAPVLTIHRGTRQIGGCCTEIRLGAERLLLDFGSNLPDTEPGITDEELAERIIANRAAGREALVLSHPHGDHYGLCRRLPADIPIYIGATAKEILKLLAARQDYHRQEKLRSIVDRMRIYAAPEAIDYFNEIRIVPLYVDHSAPDSHMFYIESGGRSILFTGDFRDHGIIGEDNRLWRMLNAYVPEGVDLLITEGTALSREEENGGNTVHSEAELGQRAAELFRRHKYNFVLVSSTNLDSIMEFYHHAPGSSHFVCDAYQAEVMLRGMAGMQRREHYPLYQPAARHPVIRVLGIRNYDEAQRKRLSVLAKDLGVDVGIESVSSTELYRDGFVMLVRAGSRPSGKTTFETMRDKFYPVDGQIIYSMWKGYLQPTTPANKAIFDFIGDREVEYLHTSGHAYADTVARLVAITNPGQIVPIHTEFPERLLEMPAMRDYRDRVLMLSDGEPWAIC